MTLLSKQLEQLIILRRKEILPYLFDRFNGKVQTGPFAGMTIVPRSSWGDGDTASKLLGIYEDELHPIIIDAVNQRPDRVVNIGCAEGYYAIGLSRLLSHVNVVAVDISLDAVRTASQNGAANSLKNMEFVNTVPDHSWIENSIVMTDRPLLIMDCESAELELLDLEKVPSLMKSTIIVECHDCMIPGITDTLEQRFVESHEVKRIKQKYKDPYQFEILENFSDADKWALVAEGRPSTMTWLYMVPKQ